MEALRHFAQDHRRPNFRNAVEFHFYAAEEVGLKGSEDIFGDYSDKKTDVVAFLNQDMAGGKQVKGSDDVFTIVQDYAYAPLNDFLSKIIAEVSLPLSCRSLVPMADRCSTRTSAPGRGSVVANARITLPPRKKASRPPGSLTAKLVTPRTFIRNRTPMM